MVLRCKKNSQTKANTFQNFNRLSHNKLALPRRIRKSFIEK